MNAICVYCGSRSGNRPEYAASARSLAEGLLERGIGLVYGGASVGIMGLLADAMLAGGGRVIGVIPAALSAREIAHQGLTELRVTRSMHERKLLMAELADGFIALPGGIGTLEELFEIWTWAQLGLHAKPCGLLNVAGYYDGLAAFLDHTVAEGFLQPQYRTMLCMETSPQRLLARLQEYVAPSVEKWVDRSQT